MAINKNITMKQYNGTDYDTLYPKTIAEQVDGVYSKEQVLSSATAALFGLGTDAVPDEVLAEIGKYKQYWWRRRIPSKTQYVEKLTDVTSSEEATVITTGGTSISVSKTISFDPDTGGDITLVDPESVALATWDSVSTGITQVSKITDKAPCYLNLAGTIYYLPAGATTTSFGGTGTMQVRYQSSYKRVYFGHSTSVPVIAKVVSTELSNIPAGNWEYLQSSSRSAYPDSGISGGYEYEYLGIPLDNAVGPGVKIETGSYVGTGTYGQANPNTLTFGFVPKLVIIASLSPDTIGNQQGLWISGSVKFNGQQYTNVSVVNQTMSWYSTNNASSQLNTEGMTYNYLAIG